MKPCRRSFSGGILGCLVAWAASAQTRPSRPLPQREPPETPEGIVSRILGYYRDGRPPALETLPIVPRLQDALRRTDLATDPIAEPDRAVTRLVIDIAEAMGNKQASVAARFSHGTDERRIIFDLDVTSGDWLITNIRPQGAPTLRQLLRISR